MLTATDIGSASALEAEDGYPNLERIISQRISEAKGPLFTTNVEGLMDQFLNHLPPERRQHYTCRHCTHFVERFGSLVTIRDDGFHHSLLWYWEEGLDFFKDALVAMCHSVHRSKVNGVFLSSEATFGLPHNVAGPGSKCDGQKWTHLSGKNPSVFKERTKNASQVMAEKIEDHGVLCRALAEYRLDAITEAVRVLEADALDRSEKALEIGKWFLALKSISADVHGRAGANLIWRAVATAPPGWCHVKNTVIATLMDDIMAGMDFATVSKRWKDKMHPLQYQRPTALKSGNIEAAEKLIEKLGAAKSLDRRFAKLSEVFSIWRPPFSVPTETKSGGVFDHLKARMGDAPVKPLNLPTQTLTWVRFAKEVLPDAKTIEAWAPSHGGYYGMVTAVHMDAPPIMQWDGNYPRNPTSWYFYVNGSSAQQWNLGGGGGWTKVNAICHKPPHWYQPELFPHQEWGIMLALEGCRDTIHTKGGGLFPESLKAEFREARAAIEAHANEAPIAGRDEGDANGLCYSKGKPWDCRLRVDGTEYRIDRWE